MYKLTKDECETVIETLANMLLNYCVQWDIHYLVIGISGGLDSAVVAGIAARARDLRKERGEKLTVVGVMLPCESDPIDEEYAEKVNRKFNLWAMYVDLTGAFHIIVNKQLCAAAGFIADADWQVRRLLENQSDFTKENWEKSGKLCQGNVKARLRMITARHIAGRLQKAIVLSTDNHSEWWMGFWTLDGDVGDYAPIQKILKGLELYDIARCLGVPQEIIDRAPTDGLGVNKGGDAAQLGADYPPLDTIMTKLIQSGFNINGSIEQLDRLPAIEGFDPAVVRKLAERAVNNAYKRCGTVIIERHEIGLTPIEKIKLD